MPQPDALPGVTVTATPVAEPAGTPTPSWTAVPVSPTEVVRGAAVTLSPTIPALSDLARQDLVVQAKEDLAQRLSIEVGQIDLVEAKALVWSDSSMGCPQPGVAYTQVRRDGLLIRLRVGKRGYNYHSGGNRSPFLCEQATEDGDLAPPPRSGDQ